ncbi:MAG: cobaltochelatase subunit CobN, partial [Pseudomonadota bacterium]
REKGIALTVLPADGRDDARLDAICTVPVSTRDQLRKLCDTGGAVAAQAALAQMALAAGLYAGPVPGSKALPMQGAWTPEAGVISSPEAGALSSPEAGARPRIAVVFYRSYLVAADLAPVEAVFAAMRARGFDVIGLFAPSLKAPDAAKWLEENILKLSPKAIINATSFSGRGGNGRSPLDVAEVPVFQVALSTATKKAWSEAERGLSPADLAMHVVLPEVDGRIFAGVASFKEPQAQDPALEFSRFAHSPVPDRIDALADRIAAWHHLARAEPSERRPALVLSTYPGRDWNMAHAVGLDAPASTNAILTELAQEGHDCAPQRELIHRLSTEFIHWPMAKYRVKLARLDRALRDDLQAAWGAPELDHEVQDGDFAFRAIRSGKALIALQPERGTPETRSDEYHDLSRVPRHAYVAFYLWLQEQADALIHIGAHGTLEWLPGKATALSAQCWPEVLVGDLPVIYPFIVNDPGEAAQAKRRIGAVTLGHLPPPLKAAGAGDKLARLEALLDEFSNADGLDPQRRERLIGDIREEARAAGVEADLGLAEGFCSAEAITRIDRFVCDVKDSQFGDGLHIWGQPTPGASPLETQASIEAERTALVKALNGQRVHAGPSGSPYRGRLDVLPTGRNLYTTDPRSVPTRAAFAQGERLAAELIRRHLQDEGDYPKTLVLDLWGSATMRTAGEEFAMAFALLGVRPVWDTGSERVSGIEVVPIAELSHPRIDVTLRVSGLFRDVFPGLSALYQQAIRALAGRDEAADWNPFVKPEPLADQPEEARVYGPAPGSFGLGMGGDISDFSEAGRRAAGEAWLAASAYAMDGAEARHDPDGIAARVAGAEAFVHLQDLPETDLLLAEDYASHEAGFAAAQAITGGAATLYHVDNTDPAAPRARALSEEVARVVRARAANPAWIAGMR